MIDIEKFKQETAEGLTLVKFYADWCVPCKAMSEIAKNAAVDIDAKLLGIDVEDNDNVDLALNVRNIPAFLLYKDGKELGRLIGSYRKDDFVNKLKAFIV